VLGVYGRCCGEEEAARRKRVASAKCPVRATSEAIGNAQSTLRAIRVSIKLELTEAAALIEEPLGNRKVEN